MQSMLVKPFILDALTKHEVKVSSSSSDSESDSSDKYLSPQEKSQNYSQASGSAIKKKNDSFLEFEQDDEEKTEEQIEIYKNKNIDNEQDEENSNDSSFERVLKSQKKQKGDQTIIKEEQKSPSKKEERNEIEDEKKKTLELIKSEIDNQKESLQEKLRNRKLNMLMKKYQESKSDSPVKLDIAATTNQGTTLLSPNLSNVSPDQNNNVMISPNNAPINSQLSNEDLTDNLLLRGLEQESSDIDPDEDVEEDIEGLQEIQKRKEEIMEEYLELAYQKEHEVIEETKEEIKKNKLKKDEEKKRLQEVRLQMDEKRKQGLFEIKKKLNDIIMNTSMNIEQKITRLQDTDEIKTFINQFLS